MRRTCAAFCYLLGSIVAQPARADPASADDAGSGTDIIRPTKRIDLLSELSENDDEREFTLTLRHDRKIQFRDGWLLNLRADIAFKSFNNLENNSGRSDFDVGDTLVQVLLNRKLSDSEGFGFGAQLIIPTAERDGKGKWRLRPTVGYRWGIPSLATGAFFQILARYDFSFAGDEESNKVRRLLFSPNLEIPLPGKAWVSFYPSADIRYDFVHHEFFVPVDIEVGKDWKNLVFSIEGAKAVVKGDHPPYDWRVETRVGLRF